jgi:hypothetical protein
MKPAMCVNETGTPHVSQPDAYYRLCDDLEHRWMPTYLLGPCDKPSYWDRAGVWYPLDIVVRRRPLLGLTPNPFVKPKL